MSKRKEDTMAEELLTIEEASQLLQNEAITIQSWLARGLAHTTQPDGTVVIRRSDLDAFLLREGQSVSRDAATET